MPRTKKVTPAKPQPGEVIQFADLKRKRDVRRADKLVRVHVISDEGECGDLALCTRKDGGYTFARVARKDEKDGLFSWTMTGAGETLEAFCGRVVLIEDLGEGGAA